MEGRKIKSVSLVWLILFLGRLAQGQTETPNIVLFYVDDLGYGDVGCYGATAVRTPNVDALAAQGLRFTEAHCTAATCTPSRFSLLTGQYAFRSKAAILPGDAPLIFRPGTPTVATMLQQKGYATGVVGKWHLGLGNGAIDWNGTIGPGPGSIGFDYSFIIPATTDRVPTVYVENGRVPNLDPADPIQVSYTQPIGKEPTGLSHPQLLKQKADTQHSNTLINGISRIGYMTGGKKARWVDEDIPLVLNEKAKNFIRQHRNRPFFLYYPFPNIHVPRTPNRRFAGATTMGARGDVIAEMDWLVGETIRLLDSLQLTGKTLIIFTSDNGPVLDDGYEDFASRLVGDHRPGGSYRGGKYSAYEAGTRIPMILCWKGKVKPGVSKAMLSQIDFYKSIAALVKHRPAAAEAPDSEDQLAAWLGRAAAGRKWLLEESYTFSIRQGDWKYIAPLENAPPGWLKNKKVETGLMQEEQLFNLKEDPSEQMNRAAANPGKLKQLRSLLQEIKNKQ